MELYPRGAPVGVVLKVLPVFRLEFHEIPFSWAYTGDNSEQAPTVAVVDTGRIRPRKGTSYDLLIRLSRREQILHHRGS